MAKYESGDIVTYYFIIKEDFDGNSIQGWTDVKDLAKFYLEFHKCKKFVLKSTTTSIDEMFKILEEALHDEIKVYNIIVKDPNKTKKSNFKIMSIPATETEFMFINEESNTYMASRVDYGYLNGSIPYLKDKYLRAIKNIFLNNVIDNVLHNKKSEFTNSVEFDSLMVLFKSFPDNFGD